MECSSRPFDCRPEGFVFDFVVGLSRHVILAGRTRSTATSTRSGVVEETEPFDNFPFHMPTRLTLIHKSWFENLLFL